MICRPNIKINLGLDILRKRPDGFHDIETLFLPCEDFHDTLEIVPADEPSVLVFDVLAKACGIAPAGPVGEVDAAGPAGPVGEVDAAGPAGADCTSVECPDAVIPPTWAQEVSEDGKVMITIYRAEGVHWNPLKDLCVKAYRLLEQDFNLPSIKIVLDKSSPVGAGLGGGSADAAYTLMALNEMFDLHLNQEQLASYAARLGSDCAFFIYNKPMFGSGRGEILQTYEMGDFFERYQIRCYIPEGIAVSTAQAYAGVTPRCPELSLRERLTMPVDQWKNVLVNAFEDGVVRRYPELEAFKEQIYRDGAVYASMSGSGSAFFGVFPR